MRRSWKWFQEKAKTKHAQVWLGVISFCEASFFPIITDVFLIPILSARVGRWKYYAFIVSITSVLGAMFGYALGFYVFEPVVQPMLTLYGFTEEFAYVGTLYANSTFWSVLTAAFTPIPFKVFVLAGGFFGVPLVPFLLASIIGRSARFYLVAWLADRFGPRVAEKFIQHFNQITIIIFVLFAVVLAIYFDVPELFF
jgi:membrane protein YqaA with SNARE-associated domain